MGEWTDRWKVVWMNGDVGEWTS